MARPRERLKQKADAFYWFDDDDEKWKIVRDPGDYTDGDGLRLEVSETRSKSWIFRYMIKGVTLTKSGAPTSREMGLGAAHRFTLAEARGRAAQARKLVADGVDPIKARDAAKAAKALELAKNKIFGEVAKEYIAEHRH